MPTSSGGAYASTSRYQTPMRSRRSDVVGHPTRYDKKLSIDNLPTPTSRKPSTLTSQHRRNYSPSSNSYSQHSQRDVDIISDRLQRSDIGGRPYGSPGSSNHYSTSSSAYGGSVPHYGRNSNSSYAGQQHVSSGLNGGQSKSSFSSRSPHTDSHTVRYTSPSGLSSSALRNKNESCSSPGSDVSQVRRPTCTICVCGQRSSTTLMISDGVLLSLLWSLFCYSSQAPATAEAMSACPIWGIRAS